MSASVYGFAYLLTEALPRIYTEFGFDAEASAKMYFFLAVGAFLALGVRLIDAHRATQRTQRGEALVSLPRVAYCLLRRLHWSALVHSRYKLTLTLSCTQSPEDKLLGFYIAAVIQALAFWLLAWTIPPFAGHISPYISVIAIVPTGFAINEFDHVLLGYLVDCYTSVAGSACAPLGALRSILSAVLPILGLKMFDRLGNNYAVSVVAAIASLYIGVAVAFYFRGERFREASPWARKQRENQPVTVCSERSEA
jgi:hypothetical protein